MTAKAPDAGQRPRTEVFAEVAALCGVLSSPVRLELLWLLAAGERDVGGLAAALGQPLAAASHHLAKLRRAGLVGVRRHGRCRLYTADDREMIDQVEAAVAARRPRHSTLSAARRGEHA